MNSMMTKCFASSDLKIYLLARLELIFISVKIIKLLFTQKKNSKLLFLLSFSH